MRNKYSVFFLSLLLTNCQTDNLSIISLDNAQPLKATLLFVKDSSNYIYELKASNTNIAILDQESDTLFSLYEKDNYAAPIFVIKQDSTFNRAWQKPYFSKEVATNGEILLVKDNSSFYRLSSEGTNWKFSQEGRSFHVINSFQYNRTQNEIYAVPFQQTQSYPNPFYYYNPTEGYYWVNADSSVQLQLADDPISYLCELCVNEKADKVVAAYRFTNHITFYNLTGEIEKNIRIGSNTIVPKRLGTGALDIQNTTKCILNVCGTPRYLYCLYSGSCDYTAPAYLIAFKWNGKHHKTWCLNKNIRTISVSNDNKTCYAVESIPNKAQIVSCYMLQ